MRISSSPGIGGDPNSPSQFIFASDQCALVEVADRCVHLNDDDVVHVDGKGRLEIHQCGMTACERATGESSGPGTPIYREIQTLSQAREEVILDGYSHYMEKEIHEQPESLRNALRGRIHVIPRTDKKLFDECLWKKWLKKDQEPLRLKMGGMEVCASCRLGKSKLIRLIGRKETLFAFQTANSLVYQEILQRNQRLPKHPGNRRVVLVPCRPRAQGAPHRDESAGGGAGV